PRYQAIAWLRYSRRDGCAAAAGAVALSAGSPDAARATERNRAAFRTHSPRRPTRAARTQPKAKVARALLLEAGRSLARDTLNGSPVPIPVRRSCARKPPGVSPRHDRAHQHPVPQFSLEPEVLREGACAAWLPGRPGVRRFLWLHPGRASRLLGDQRQGRDSDPPGVPRRCDVRGRPLLPRGDRGRRQEQRPARNARRVRIRGVRAGSGRAQRGGGDLERRSRGAEVPRLRSSEAQARQEIARLTGPLRNGVRAHGPPCRSGWRPSPQSVTVPAPNREQEGAMSLRINDEAPNFTAQTTQGPIDFHQWIGNQWAILFSHPKDFTPVCTTELGYMARIKPEFDKRNTKIIGLSVDSVEDHKRWSNDIEETQGAAPNYPMIGDADFKVAKLYDMLPASVSGDAKTRTPADNATVRAVFIIAPDKKIKLILMYPMTTGRNFDELLRALDSIQLTAKHKVATPANWKQGQDVIIAGSVSDEDAKKIYPAGWKAPKPYLRIVKQPH